MPVVYIMFILLNMLLNHTFIIQNTGDERNAVYFMYNFHYVCNNTKLIVLV